MTTQNICIYTLCPNDSPTPNTLESACGDALWYLGDDMKNPLPKYCYECGGLVKFVGMEKTK